MRVLPTISTLSLLRHVRLRRLLHSTPAGLCSIITPTTHCHVSASLVCSVTVACTVLLTAIAVTIVILLAVV